MILIPDAPVAAAASAAAFAAMLAKRLSFNLPPLRVRVRPYVESGFGPAVDSLGTTAERPLRSFVMKLARMVEGSSTEALLRKLRQAGVLRELAESERVDMYRSRVAATTVGGAVLGLVLAAITGRSGLAGLTFSVLGATAGAAFWRGRLDRAIERRRAAIRIELYTVDQLLAMHVRVGSGVVSAVRRLAARGSGEVVGELHEALRLHRGGLPAAEAFRHIAGITPEPHARRTYQTLAVADERGFDVAGALLALSEDVREGRRDAIRRRATRRRALMLVPILGLLAPTLVLFVAAPLPWLVIHGFG